MILDLEQLVLRQMGIAHISGDHEIGQVISPPSGRGRGREKKGTYINRNVQKASSKKDLSVGLPVWQRGGRHRSADRPRPVIDSVTDFKFAFSVRTSKTGSTRN